MKNKYLIFGLLSRKFLCLKKVTKNKVSRRCTNKDSAKNKSLLSVFSLLVHQLLSLLIASQLRHNINNFYLNN